MIKKEKKDLSEDVEFVDDVHENKVVDNDEFDGYNDVTFDEESTPIDKIKKMNTKLKQCQKEKQEYLDGWQRAKADMVNQKKSFDVSRKEYVTYATEQFVEELFPVLDSYQMAFSDKQAWESVDENWRKGIEYIYSQLLSTLQNNGLSMVDPIGIQFDPNLHNSVESVDTVEESDDGKILSVVQKGYSLHGKIARPPKVKVGLYKKENEGTDG